MPHSSHRSSRFLNALTVSPWPLILVTCYNVAPHVDWRNFFSIPICFFWYRVSIHVLLCHTDSYPVWKKQCGSTPSLPVTILYVSMRSSRCLLFSSEVNFSLFSLSYYGNLQKPLTILVALLWTLSRQSISLRRYGDQACMAYCKWGLT